MPVVKVSSSDAYEAPGGLACQSDVRGARCLAKWCRAAPHGRRPAELPFEPLVLRKWRDGALYLAAELIRTGSPALPWIAEVLRSAELTRMERTELLETLRAFDPEYSLSDRKRRRWRTVAAPSLSSCSRMLLLHPLGTAPDSVAPRRSCRR
jgi:hypothetical protein